MPFDDGPDDRPDDDPVAFRPPPPQDDRLWRHPSEFAPVASRARGHMWVVALCAGSVGALMATGVIAATGGLRREVTVVQPTSTLPRVIPLSAQPDQEDISRVADTLRPSIARVTGVTDGGAVIGSGVFFRADGYLLTNWHIVDGAKAIRVVTAFGKDVPGRVVGADRDTDVAVVKVEGGPYQPARLGTASNLKIGQRAIALGSSVGTREPSVSAGVVSALHRQVAIRDRDTPLLDMIQIDASISPNSSGGALVDRDGHVIGITTAGAMKLRGFLFATPIETARLVGDQLVATGRFVHVWLGIEGNDVDGAMASLLGVDGGAVVDRAVPDGPAARAGLLPRDVIVGIDDRAVVTMSALVVSLRGRPPGEVVTLDVLRNMQRRELRVTLEARPERT
jgi:serine protease Do